jgi:hypothetical protein
MPPLRPMAMFFAALPLAAALHGPVRVESGRLSGIAGSNAAVTVFKGIPFAAPPLGDLRWRPPQPAARWKGVRQAARFSAACMQTPYPAGSLYRLAPEPIGEDCLYLNVWTAANSVRERRPVMVRKPISSWGWATRSKCGRRLIRPPWISSTPGSAGKWARRCCGQPALTSHPTNN